jgi:hypothetical protein
MYLLGIVYGGKQAGIYEISIANRKMVPVVPGVMTWIVRNARDGKSFLYGVVSHNKVTFYRQAWSDGKLLGKPQIALELPFALSFHYPGSGFDFTRDLSTIVYARPGEARSAPRRARFEYPTRARGNEKRRQNRT